jgi:hypothetical protein
MSREYIVTQRSLRLAGFRAAHGRNNPKRGKKTQRRAQKSSGKMEDDAERPMLRGDRLINRRLAQYVPKTEIQP